MTCVGQVIGAVVAETQAQAQRAAKMVKISYEELPRILTIEVIALLISRVFRARLKFNFGLVCRPLMPAPALESNEIIRIFSPLKGLAVISHFEVARETGLMLCRSALRDCFEDANTFSLTVAQVSLHLARLWKQPYDKCYYLHMLYSLVSCIY